MSSLPGPMRRDCSLSRREPVGHNEDESDTVLDCDCSLEDTVVLATRQTQERLPRPVLLCLWHDTYSGSVCYDGIVRALAGGLASENVSHVVFKCFKAQSNAWLP